MGEGNSEPPNILAEVNARIREVADRSTARADEWEFLCECGCEERVMMTLDRYERMTAAGTSILVHGHKSDARVRAHALREDAKALQAQAKHQVARAMKHKRA
ncbi:MAG: hypothetical protein ACREF0_08840 [Acetobacteraceae bacterium]